jgi:hypothetical protein
MRRLVSASDVYFDMLDEIEQYLKENELRSFCFADIGRLYFNTKFIQQFLNHCYEIPSDCLAEMTDLVELIEALLDVRHGEELLFDSIKNLLIAFNELEYRFKLTKIGLQPIDEHENAFRKQIRLDQDLIVFSPGLRARIDEILSM